MRQTRTFIFAQESQPITLYSIVFIIVLCSSSRIRRSAHRHEHVCTIELHCYRYHRTLKRIIAEKYVLAVEDAHTHACAALASCTDTKSRHLHRIRIINGSRKHIK